LKGEELTSGQLCYGFNDSVYARSWDHPLMAGVCAAV